MDNTGGSRVKSPLGADIKRFILCAIIITALYQPMIKNNIYVSWKLR